MKINFPNSNIKTKEISFNTNLQHDIKIVHITDTHIGYHFDLEDLHQLVLSINALKPDIVCFTGDCFDNIKLLNFNPKLIIPLLKTIYSKYGKYFVPGNHDYGSNSISEVLNIITQSGFNILLNKHHYIQTHGGNILIQGIDDACFGQPSYNASFKHDEITPDFSLCLMHEPDNVKLLNPNINLVLSGHTHGGQVRLPKYGAIYTPDFGKIYKQGLYQIRRYQYLYVNFGIGMTRLPIRLFCQPEIALFYLKANAYST